MQLVWLKNDIRLDDNPALFYACQQSSSVRVVFITMPGQWNEHHESGRKLALLNEALNDLITRLAELGISFELLHADVFDDCAQLLQHYCQTHNISNIRFNREYPLNERRRDDQVINALEQNNITVHTYEADLILQHVLKNQQQQPYKVFTPWYRNWVKQLSDDLTTPLAEPPALGKALQKPDEIVFSDCKPFRTDLWPTTEAEARLRLDTFIQQRSEYYASNRDIPAINGTSTLSPYLSTGLLSVRRCLFEAKIFAAKTGKDWREDIWIRELGWREFYRNLIIEFPKLSMGTPFKDETRNIPWEYNPQQYEAWKKGLTGYPIIDAAMRQLERSGWMHNRLRMLTASFFCKLMLHDWHLGEKYFMQQLIDGDFASNNGGWQWSASTGCDASPWFRIFNPTRQSEKFDADGHFIRKMVPELKDLDSKKIHDPPADIRAQLDYPKPIIDYKTTRQRALDRFKNNSS